MSRPIRRTKIPAAMLTLVFLGVPALASGCGQSSSGSSPTTAPAARSTIGSISDLQKSLESKDIPCKLEYEGLRQEGKVLSICIIDGSQATLTIWDDPAFLEKFLASDVRGTGSTAVGANWTVDVDDVPTAQKVATALGGTVKSAGGPQNPTGTTLR